MLPERSDEGVPTRPQAFPDPREPRLQQAAREELADDRLRQRDRCDVGRRCQRLDRRDQIVRHEDISDAESRGDRLGERRGVDDSITFEELEQRGKRLSVEPDESVGIVLHDEQVVRASELGEAQAAGERERRPRRVLKGRDRVEERRSRTGAEARLERPEVEALLVDRHADDFRAEVGEQAERAIVRGRLHEHAAPVPGEQVRGDEGQPLQRAVAEDHATGVELVPLGNAGPERRVPARPAVREHGRRRPLQDGPGARRDLLQGQELRIGDASGQRDRLHAPRV